MKAIKRVLTGLMVLLIPMVLIAQPAGMSGAPPAKDTSKKSANAPGNSGGGVSTFTSNPASAPGFSNVKSGRSGMDEFLKLLPVLVLAFGALIVFFLLVLIRNGTMDSDESIKIITIVLIITGLLFIISSGTSPSTAVNTNLFAPAFGLLGSIAGYVFGRSVATAKTHTADAPATKDKNDTSKDTPTSK